ncbi:acyl-CoA N-acyltransferase [Chaetomidium leptoderma]|uniref:Acyl-CoA N-acyltransferase n=1 Tax=Chaetomidium leptoderma TaxID=669021 RepID=A0AAN6VHW7_9PEZI|nr:acyl-CoA N-acyltransferase [Chaetomidium leptoderma]
MAPPTKLNFRVATPADASIIHPLVEAAYRGDESRLGWTTEADLISGKRIDAADLLVKITDPDGAVLIATTTTTNIPGQEKKEKEAVKVEEEVVVGCCEVVARRTTSTAGNPKTAYFGMFAVSPRRQGGGIGRQVLAYAEAYCRREWGTERMEMTVIPSRSELLEWYMRRGYASTGEARPFPFEELEKLNSVALVEDLSFQVLEKDLRVVVVPADNAAAVEVES